MIAPTDADWRRLFQAGGISALTLGIGYVAIIALYIPMGAPPSGSEARLAYLAGNVDAWWAILALSVLTDLLFIPVALSLYVALKGVSRSAMLAATACVALFVVLDLAITWTNYAALINLAGKYTRAASEARRMAVITAADYPSAVLESKLLFVYNTFVPAAGILITGFVMLKARFSKTAAYLGLATGVLGVISVAGAFFISALSFAVVITSVLTTVWLWVIGYKLYALGRQGR